MNKAKESIKISNNLKRIDIKPIPISKKCKYCRQLKLVSEFEFDLNIPTKDHRAVTCIDCMKKFEVEEQEDYNCHSEDCITEKFLLAVSTQLDALKALSENGMLIPDEILEQMFDIIAQDERNSKDLDEED